MAKQGIVCSIALATLILSPLQCISAGNTSNDSFSRAKKMLERQVYADHRVTIYCGAEYDDRKNVSIPIGFKTPSHSKRARRVEWEHAVPTENFGRAFKEWRDGDPRCVDNRGNIFRGRKCAEKINMEFRYMQSDMYNLFPSIGAVNAVRSNKQYSALPDTSMNFGSCLAKVDANRFEPPDRAKGQVARAALYMDASYPRYRLSKQQARLFEAWDRMFPVDEWECERAVRIEKLQGNANEIVKSRCEKAGLLE